MSILLEQDAFYNRRAQLDTQWNRLIKKVKTEEQRRLLKFILSNRVRQGHHQDSAEFWMGNEVGLLTVAKYWLRKRSK